MVLGWLRYCAINASIYVARARVGCSVWWYCSWLRYCAINASIYAARVSWTEAFRQLPPTNNSALSRVAALGLLVRICDCGTTLLALELLRLPAVFIWDITISINVRTLLKEYTVVHNIHLSVRLTKTRRHSSHTILSLGRKTINSFSGRMTKSCVVKAYGFWLV